MIELVLGGTIVWARLLGELLEEEGVEEMKFLRVSWLHCVYLHLDIPAAITCSMVYSTSSSVSWMVNGAASIMPIQTRNSMRDFVGLLFYLNSSQLINCFAKQDTVE